MASFNIRVELHYATPSDYQTLTETMISAGFKDYVVGVSGTTYDLPPGEYSCETTHSLDRVREIVAGVAKKTGRKFGVRVTQGQSSFEGLKLRFTNAKSFLNL